MSNVATGVVLKGLVLAQANTALPVDALVQVGRAAGGLVLTDNAGLNLADRLQAAGFQEPLVLDLLDVGFGAQSPTESCELAWSRADQQTAADVLVTPCPRIAAGDVSAVREQLRRGEQYRASTQKTVITGLALDARWLKAASAQQLRRALPQSSSVALAFASTHDPLGSQEAVASLRHLLRDRRVVLLRTDLAGMGAVAYGADFAAVGLTSSIRHLVVPRKRRKDAPPPRPSTHVLVPGCYAWIEAERLWLAGPHAELFCSCPAHPTGQWLGELRDREYKSTALLHAFYTWLEVADRLTAIASDELALEWGGICRNAVKRLAAIEEATQVSFSHQPLRWWTL